MPPAPTRPGSAATARWGGPLRLASAVSGAAGRPTPAMNLTYAVPMVTGPAVVAPGARFLAARSRHTNVPAGPGDAL
ncbi:hypothetical protein ABZX93_07605 [Streptomyces sp. NPDC006632]|uniref:hypothetical protein n=1 Tax=Streptomyces sp. NPDC006632 TaxID=3157182 RepID=UPI0033BBC908